MIGTIGSLLGVFVVLLNPVNSKMLKLGLLAFVFGAWAGVTILSWKRKGMRLALLVFPVLAGGLSCCPVGRLMARSCGRTM